MHENLGPTEDDDTEFGKELAKLVTDTSGDSRKVDKKTALALWDTALPPPVMRKKRNEDIDDDGDSGAENAKDPGIMNFTLFTKRGNKQQVGYNGVDVECIIILVDRPGSLRFPRSLLSLSKHGRHKCKTRSNNNI